MKSQTYKLLLGALILLQIIAIATAGLAAAQGGGGNSGSTDQLSVLITDVLKGGVIVNDMQMSFATGQRIADMEPYEEQKTKLFAELDALEKAAQEDPTKVALYQDQKKLIKAADDVVLKLKSLVDQPTGDRMSRMIMMFAGLRKISNVSHKLTDNFETLCQSTSKQSLPVLTIATIASCVVSLLLVAALFKAPVE